MRNVFLPCVMIACTGSLAGAAGDGKTPMSLIENDQIRLGADLDIGGSITHLSTRTGPNMINSHDWGRQIQMSFYSGPNPFEPDGKKPHKSWAALGWNPIQSGDCFGKKSEVLEHTNDGKTIYVKCRPKHWPLNDQPGQCIFECWYTLEANRVHVRSRLTNARDDNTQYTARTQELPAIYTNGPWYKLVAYKGDRPFTGAKPTVIVDKNDGKGWPWRNFYSPEQWVALLDDNDQGLGVYHPGVYDYTGGFAGRPKGKGGPKASQTGYMGPTIPEILDHHIVYTYDYTLIVGSIKEIRDYVYAQQKDRPPPQWQFKHSREHWTYEHITDQGWPIQGTLRFDLGPAEARIRSPHTFWRAEEASSLELRGSFTTAAKKITVLIKPYGPRDAGDWAQWGPQRENRPKPAEPIAFELPISGDGQVRTMKIDLSNHPAYRGAMTQVMIALPTGEGNAAIYEVKLIPREQE